MWIFPSSWYQNWVEMRWVITVKWEKDRNKAKRMLGKPKLSWDETASMPLLYLINFFTGFVCCPPVGSSSQEWWGILSCDLLVSGSSWEWPHQQDGRISDCRTFVQWSTNFPPLLLPAGSGEMHCGILTSPKSTQVLSAGHLIREGQEHFWGTWSVLTNLLT